MTDFEHEHADEPDGADAIVLRAGTGRFVWVLIGSLVFLTFGAGLALGERTGGVAKSLGVLLIVGFGWCAIVALRQVLSPGSLTITHTSIELISLGRHRSFAFADCGPFRTWRNPSRGTVMIVFDYAPDGDTDTAVANRRITGGSRSLPDGYGASPIELAELLEKVRVAALDARDVDD